MTTRYFGGRGLRSQGDYSTAATALKDWAGGGKALHGHYMETSQSQGPVLSKALSKITGISQRDPEYWRETL